jgi:prepilin-type processing-associated H-X9-DG protein
MVLPQLELSAIYNGINFGNNRAQPQGDYDCAPEYWVQEARRAGWSHIPGVLHCPSDPLMQSWMTNYLGVAGNAQPLDWSMNREYYPGDELESPGNGMLYLCSSTNLTQCLDGSSQTLFVGEQGSNPPQGGGPNILLNDARGERSAWMTLSGGLRPGNSTDPGVHFWSYHYGGANFLFADGHVRLLSYSMDGRIYYALGSRDGGETIGEF